MLKPERGQHLGRTGRGGSGEGRGRVGRGGVGQPLA